MNRPTGLDWFRAEMKKRFPNGHPSEAPLKRTPNPELDAAIANMKREREQVGHATIREQAGTCPKCDSELEPDPVSGVFVCPRGLREHAEWLAEEREKIAKKEDANG